MFGNKKAPKHLHGACGRVYLYYWPVTVKTSNLHVQAGRDRLKYSSD